MADFAVDFVCVLLGVFIVALIIAAICCIVKMLK